MLSDHERRVLEDLERSFASEPFDNASPGCPAGRVSARRSPSAGSVVVAALGCVSVMLLVTGVAVAALAIATATAICWLFSLAWTRRADGALTAALMSGSGSGKSGSRRRPGESLRDYLRWLSEAQ